MPLFLLRHFLKTFMEREVVADVHYCPVDKKEKVKNHKGTDVQQKGVCELALSYRGQR